LADFPANGLDICFGVVSGRQFGQPFESLLMNLVFALDEELLDHPWETIERNERSAFGGRTRGLHCVSRKTTPQRDTSSSQRKRMEHPATRHADATGRTVLIHLDYSKCGQLNSPIGE
jgi:hypothetical protein